MASIWDDVRLDVPAATRHVYLNAASASPVLRPVRAAVDRHYAEMEADGDLAWERWLERAEAARAKVAAFVGADPAEIAFVPNTSTGINFVIDLIGPCGPIVTDTLEFPTMTLPWIHRGVDVQFVEPDRGVIVPEMFAPSATTARTIVLSHVQFSNGCRQDLEAFGATKGDRWLVVGGSQSTGVFPVDVRRQRLDAFVASGHKWLCAGYGAGFLYTSRDLLRAFRPRTMGWLSVEHPFGFDIRRYTLLPDSRRLEMGCPPFAGIFALGAAVEYWSAIGVDRLAERVLALNTHLTDALARVGVDVLSPLGVHRSGETLVRLAEPARAVQFLRERNVFVSEKPEGVRIATHVYNTEADIDAAAAAISAYVGRR
ncbi:MAG: aminotransferase class V-fold PLP-dependent enzyme [Vicinamibacterales bacterium]